MDRGKGRKFSFPSSGGEKTGGLERKDRGEQPLRGTSISQIEVRLAGLVGGEREEVSALVALGKSEKVVFIWRFLCQLFLPSLGVQKMKALPSPPPPHSQSQTAKRAGPQGMSLLFST